MNRTLEERAMAVVDVAVASALKGWCHFCPFVRPHNKVHRNDCPLIVNGFLLKEDGEFHARCLSAAKKFGRTENDYISVHHLAQLLATNVTETERRLADDDHWAKVGDFLWRIKP